MKDMVDFFNPFSDSSSDESMGKEYKDNFDIQEITQQVGKVIQHSQNLSHVNVNKLITQWQQAKRGWIYRFKGDLIYQYPEKVTFTLDAAAKQELVSKFIDKIENFYGNELLARFVYKSGVSAFFNNLTEYPYDFQDYHIPEHYKLIKAFKFFVPNEDILKDIQNEASAIIQQNVVSGYLCFSVHPLDYLSLSENVHNWRSCHALDGEFRSGNLNYMVDDTTIICYLRAEKMAVLPHFPEDVLWNSKKWRVLLYFSNDETMMFLGRQYPFESNVGLQMIKDEFLSKFCFYKKWTDFHEPISNKLFDPRTNDYIEVNSNRLIPVGSSVLDIHDLVKDGKHTYHFDDLLRSSCYTPMYSYVYADKWLKLNEHSTGYTNGDTTRFEIGAEAACPCCGQKYVCSEELMLCRDCVNQYEQENYLFECEMCGNSYPERDMYILPFSDMRVCPRCFETNTYQCDHCGLADTQEYVRVRDEDGTVLCEDCFRRQRHKNFGRHITSYTTHIDLTNDSNINTQYTFD